MNNTIITLPVVVDDGLLNKRQFKDQYCGLEYLVITLSIKVYYSRHRCDQEVFCFTTTVVKSETI